MDKWLKRSVDLMFSLSMGDGDGPSVIPYYPQKTAITGDEKKYFKRVIPERHGVSSARIYSMLSELEWERRANIHSLLILRDGEVISECSRDGYSTLRYHLSHSMSKTVTGMAIGALSDDGLLHTDDRLCDFFPELTYKDRRFADITVGHLLSMQSGIPFSEVGSVTELRWTETIFDSNLKFAPGTAFRYNSMNSYMLGRIVERITGVNLAAFVDRRIFSPLGITNFLWEKGPEGTEKGGWGLYLSPESWAKLGQMLLEGGIFHDERILSEEWIAEATTPHALSPMASGDFNYAYQLWVGRSSDEILFNGMLGQNVWICPKNRLVAVITAGNNELFQISPALDIVRKYLGCEINDTVTFRGVRAKEAKESDFFGIRRWVRPREKGRGVLCFLGLRNKMPFDQGWNDMLRTLVFPRNSISLLPLIVCGMQNNFSDGLERITLSRVGDSLIMSFTESGIEQSIEIGLYGYSESVLNFKGELYKTLCMGEVHQLSSGGTEYRIELIFSEMPNTRMITVTRSYEGVYDVKFSEMPNGEIIRALIARLPERSTVASLAMDILKRKWGEDFVKNKLEEIFTPSVKGFDSELDDLTQLISDEEKNSEGKSRLERLLRMIVTKFFKESVSDSTLGINVDGNTISGSTAVL